MLDDFYPSFFLSAFHLIDFQTPHFSSYGLELGQPVELIENIYVDAHPTTRKPQLDGGKSTLM